MKHESMLIDELPREHCHADPRQWRETGAALGRTHRDARPHGGKKTAPPNRRRRVQGLIARAAADSNGENAAWVLDNFRLIFGTEKEVREFAFGLREFPVIVDSSGAATPRVCLLARAYLEACEYDF